MKTSLLESAEKVAALALIYCMAGSLPFNALLKPLQEASFPFYGFNEYVIKASNIAVNAP